MENIFQPFPTFIYQNLIEEKVYTFIKKDINNFINNNRSEITTIPGWICNTKSTFSKKDINSKLLNINNLKKSIHFHIENYFKVWSFKQDLDYRIDDIWLNIAKKDEYQEEHNHFDNLFSGVIYIQTPPNSGNFEFINPLTAQAILMKNSNSFPFARSIKPIESMIMLFPSWMSHRVLPNNSLQDRISISFNIRAEYIN